MKANFTWDELGININKSVLGEQKTLCPVCSHKRKPEHRQEKCLSVNSLKGTYHCHNCGWSGSIYGKKETVIEIEDNSPDLDETVINYFAERKITKAVLKRNKIGTYRRNDKIYIAFKYYFNNKLVNIKYRSLDKTFYQTKNGYSVFYKIDDIKNLKNNDFVIITEGEIDALSFEVAGFYNVVSVPNGASASKNGIKMAYLDNTHELFKNKIIYLATDNDAPGLSLREELARRFDKARCKIVEYPPECKDANDVLVLYGVEKLKEIIANAQDYPVEGAYAPNDFRDTIIDIYNRGIEDGVKVGIEGFDDLIKFYPKQLTAITGIPAHGKSNFLDFLSISLAKRNGWRFAIFSPEHPTEIHLLRLLNIYLGKTILPNYPQRATLEEVNEGINFLNEYFNFIIPKNERFTLDNILKTASDLVLQKGINALIIDPWNTIEHQIGNETETVYTARVLNKIKMFARNKGLHVFIVAHPRKMAKKPNGLYEVPTLYDISGSANWYNIVDNGICIYRNFNAKFEDIYTTVFVQKVKHNFIGKVGYIKFTFNTLTQSFELYNNNKYEEKTDGYEDPDF